MSVRERKEVQELLHEEVVVVLCRVETRKENPMRLQDWEATIQTIAHECNLDRNGEKRVLVAWRVKLEEEPNLLQPYQIDQIVREVRQRLIHVSR
ncbi:MAG: hypothetical protein ACYC6Y_04845 [Thermoguttaceae bacterium]